MIIKPNLVGVYNKLGFKPDISPQATDPRVIDSVVEYFKQFTNDIIIAEASGSGFPTRTSYKIAGINKIARHHKIKLVNIEEQPVDRYYLPKAKVMKECLLPKIFSEVVEDKAFYVSLPKLKTNLYTEVTLGFKNGMGIIPLNLRQRHHNYNLENKLVDLLYVLKPNLTIIDGIVGAQGQAPAIVEPVKSHLIVSGTNAVETDRIATELMGINPENVKLIRIAKELGFGNTKTTIIGKKTGIAFKQADPSLLNDNFHKKFPKINVLIGHDKENAPKISDITKVTLKQLLEMELVCRGGCLVTTRMGLEMIYAEEVSDYNATIIIGNGVMVKNKGPYYFDRTGKAYTITDIEKITSPKLAVGDCTKPLKNVVDLHIEGCLYHPGLVHLKLHKISHTKCKMISTKNKHLLPFILDTLRMRIARRKQIRKGRNVDIGLDEINTINEPPQVTNEDKELDYIKWNFPLMSKQRKRKLLKDEWKSLAILF